MDPMDDPEARIRDLERPLSERAKASELTSSASELGTGYGYVPPESGQDSWGNAVHDSAPFTDSTYPPPPVYGPSSAASLGGYGSPGPQGMQGAAPPPPAGSYPPPPGPYGPNSGVTFGTPFPPRPGRSGGGFPVKTFVLIFVAVVGVIVAGSVWAVVSSVTSTIDSFESNFPSYSPGGGSSETTAGPGSTVTISGIQQEKTIVCTGGIVNVSGIENTITVTGDCAQVVVSGFENVVSVESADSITASGANNRITYDTGTPQIQNIGSANTIERA